MSFLFRKICISILLLFHLHFYSTNATFGDYEDLSFQCPALTTCPIVCVADANDCPWSLTCQDGGNLCSDGSCSENCDASVASPCLASCAPVACAKNVEYYDQCLSSYQELYDYADQCAKEEQTTRRLTFTESAFVFCYSWMTLITLLIVGWCSYNQRWAPVHGSTKQLLYPEESSIGIWFQTAYREEIFGTFIYISTMLTIFGLQALLAVLTVLYYVQQGAITRWQPVFEDEKQVLLAFEITWTVGLVWTFMFKWPHSVQSLFYRRCTFKDAAHVAIFAPPEALRVKPKDRSYVSQILAILNLIGVAFHSFMAFIFSDVSCVDRSRIKFCPVRTENGIRFFYFQLRRYNYDFENDQFVPGELSLGNTIGLLHDARAGLTQVEVEKRRSVIGMNTIQLDPPDPIRAITDEFSGVFYTYQSFVIFAWFPLWYFYMAFVYTFIVISAGFSNAYFQYRSEKTLFQLTKCTGTVEVFRNGKLISISQEEIVPGDVILLKPGLAYCDMVVLCHTNLLVDESALTGESTPLSKSAIPLDSEDRNIQYDELLHKKHTIYCGSVIIESSETENDIAVVTKTASFTSKGNMLREIFSFERHQFKFDAEVKLVLVILLFYAIFCFVITMHFIKESPVYGWFYGVFAFAAAIPPLLPTAFVISVGISDGRLSRKRIACSNSQNILVAGKVQKALFDKTGTLTKQGLDFLSAKNCDNWSYRDEDCPVSGELASAMACCNTLVQSNEGALVGNAVDKIMFEAIGATLNHHNGEIQIMEESGRVVKVVKRHEFDHRRMTQSVIVEYPEGNFVVFVKGSAESIKNRCLSESIPKDFDDVVNKYSRRGVYQISVGMKEIPSGIVDVGRDQLEKDLKFIGLVNFKNVLRDETCKTIKELEEGDIQPIIVTGDSLLTGICIAQECGIMKPGKTVLIADSVDSIGCVTWVNENDYPMHISSPKLRNQLPLSKDIELAMTGPVWSAILDRNKELAMELIEHVKVYGRCTPNDKVSVVSALNEKGYITSMCGDGGNDCGALKTAHVGIALSDAEASIVSPFTSLDKSISSILDVLKEGRCALASAFASYKYMIQYGQTEAFNQIACAYFQVTFSEWCWVFLDGVWVISMAFTLPLAKAAKTLAPERPTSSLLGPQTMASSLGVLLLNFSFMIIGIAALVSQSWYQCRKWGSTDVSNATLIGDNYEASVIFLVTGYQYIATAMAYNFGYAFRSNWIKNKYFVLLAFAFTILHFYITLVPGKLSCFFRVNCSNENVQPFITEPDLVPIMNPFNTTVMPLSFRFILIIIIVANTAAVMYYEYFVVNGIIGKDFMGRNQYLQKRKNEKVLELLKRKDFSDGSPFVNMELL